jgi:hypothetical protein
MSKSSVRIVAAIAVSTILFAQGVFASTQQTDRGGFLDSLMKAKHLVVKILSEIGLPPG